MNRVETVVALKRLQLDFDAFRVGLSEIIAALDQETAAEPPSPAPSPPAVSHVAIPAAEPEVLPKPKAPTFVGKLYIARAGGTCTVCGDQIEAGHKYLWDGTSKRGAHYTCGHEAGARPRG